MLNPNFNKPCVVAALKDAQQKYKTARSAIPKHFPEDSKKNLAISSISKDLAQQLLKFKPFNQNPPIYISIGLGSTQINTSDFAEKLVRQVMDGESAESAIECLMAVFRLREATGKVYSSVWGVTGNKTIKFDNGVTLTRSTLEIATNPSDLMAFSMPPQAVLSVPHNISPIFYDSTAHSTFDAQFAKNYDHLKDVALAMTLIGPSSPLIIKTWFEFDSLELQRVFPNQRSLRSHHEVVPFRFAQLKPIDTRNVKNLAKHFIGFKSSQLDLMRLSLNRFNQSLRRLSPEDACLDLAIVLEAVLGDSQSDSISHKLRVRGALLLGGTAEVRKNNFKILKELYDIRSGLVHNKKRKEINKNHETVEAANKIVNDILRKIVNLGFLPNWHHFDLTGKIVDR